jgi:hypothetical protein
MDSSLVNKFNPIEQSKGANLFIVLGGHKCGTTSLFNYLGQHPEITMPKLKGEDILKKPKMTLEQYYNQYENIENGNCFGEVSSAYLFSEKACKNIKKYLPEAKLIVNLRNPVERAFSHFNDMPKTHPLAQKNCTIEELCRNPQDFSGENVIYLGLYSSYIPMFLQEFKREQILFLLFDDFVNNKQKYYSSFFEFIGVDPNFIPNTSVILRKGGKAEIKNKQINQLLFNQDSLVRSAVSSIIRPFTTPDQRRLLSWRVRNIFVKRKSVSKLPNQLKENLINFYREDILKTQDLVNIDLSHWLKI